MIIMGMMPWENSKPFDLKMMNVFNTQLHEVMSQEDFDCVVRLATSKNISLQQAFKEMINLYSSK